MKLLRFICIFCIFTLSAIAETQLKNYTIPESSAEIMTGIFNLDYHGIDTMELNSLAELNYNGFFSSMDIAKNFEYKFRIGFVENNPTPENNRFFIGCGTNNSVRKYFNENSNIFFNYGFISSFYYANKYGELSNITLQPQAGIGYGRIVEVTSLAKALRVQEYLIEQKILKEEFSQEELKQIADHLYRYTEYYKKDRDRHPIEFYNDLEKILLKTGKLVDGKFSPYALFRIEEVIKRETIYLRLSGWTISGGINDIHSIESYSQFKRINNLNNIGLFLDFNFGHPISNKLQFNQQGYYYFSNHIVFENLDNIYFNSEYNMNHFFLNNILTYELTNKIDINLTYLINGISYSSFSMLSQSLAFAFHYYLENNIFLTLNSRFQYNINPSSFYYYNKKIQKSVTIDFGYRFL